MSDRVVVFLDWQNVYRGARRAFHNPADPYWMGQVDPLRLGRHLAQDSPFDRTLTQVRVYRGHPVSSRDPRGYAAARRQIAAWRRGGQVEVTTRELRYPSGWPKESLPGEKPQEKGIDVALVIDFVAMALRGEFEVGIMFSTDTDLKPALEFVSDLTSRHGKPRAEVAAWSSGPAGPGGRPQPAMSGGALHHDRRLSISGRRLYCHWVGEDVYRRLADSTDYTTGR